MEIIPVIKLKNKKIIEEHKDILEHLEEDKTLYVYDLDGIEKDKPDLCIYQKLSKKYNIWVDSAPRDLGDIVDIFLTGAVSVTIRKKYYPQINTGKIREISENKLYEYIDPHEKEGPLGLDVDGLMLFNEKQINFNFQIRDLFKKYSTQQDVFIYESDMNNINYWSTSNITGLLIEISSLEEAKKWILKKKS